MYHISDFWLCISTYPKLFNILYILSYCSTLFSAYRILYLEEQDPFLNDDFNIKPGSHRKIAKDYRPKTDSEGICSKSSEIAILKRFSKDFNQMYSRFLDLYLSLACNRWQSFCVNRA